MTPFRTAIVGAGLMGRWHAAYVGRAGGRVVAIVDTNADAAAQLRRRLRSARVFGQLPDCLEAEKPDVVHICTPSSLHAAQAEAALRAGAHVVVEKPAADSPEVAERVLDAAQAAGRSIVPVHQFAFQRGFQRVLRHLPALGDVVRVEFHASTAGGDGRPPSERRQLLKEIAVHPTYLLRRLVGPAAVDPDGWQVLRFTNDDLDLSARCGATTLIMAISLRARPTCNEMVVWGTQGRAVADHYHGHCVIESPRAGRWGKLSRPFETGGSSLGAAGTNLVRRAFLRQPAYPGLPELLQAFYRSVRTAGPVPVPGDEVLAVARMMRWICSAA